MKKIVPFLCLLGLLYSCESAEQADTPAEGSEITSVESNVEAPAENTEEAAAEEGAELPDADAVGNFGSEISAEGALDGTGVLAALGEADSAHIKVKGDIAAVCQAKGCWMTMPLAEEKEMMVKFKDYGFFVPINSTGKEAVVEGWVYRELVSVEELQHYASDNNASQEEIDAITEPEEKITFMADGVLVAASAEGAE